MKNKQNNELAVCGLAAVKALAEKNPQKITRFYYTAERSRLFGDLCKTLAIRKAPYNQVSHEDDLKKLSGTVHHQGVVAMIDMPQIEILSPLYIKGLIANKESALLLDHIGNANNIGAIVRSAAFFGVKNIIIPMDEAQSSITTSSYRIAQGGMEYVNILGVRSIPELLEEVRGKILRLGTDVHGTKLIEDIPSLSPEKKSLLVVLGNEENGISQAVKARCDYLLTISTPVHVLDSLNVAQAAAVILYEMAKN
ncbi:MAG: RNA methyltransferase [Treponema sp. CETP13]|nr:MAG: RNA methyltransferase [Treponema sp. CETP13]